MVLEQVALLLIHTDTLSEIGLVFRVLIASFVVKRHDRSSNRASHIADILHNWPIRLLDSSLDNMALLPILGRVVSHRLTREVADLAATVPVLLGLLLLEERLIPHQSLDLIL